MSVGVKWALIYGDSKANQAWQIYWQLISANSKADLWQWQRIAVGGRTVALAQANVDAELPSATKTPSVVLWNLGANDVSSLPSQSTWKANVRYILDAIKTKWPSVAVRIAYVWRNGYSTECDTVNGWYADIMAEAAYSSWVFAGHDERAWLGPNAATLSSDGTHYSDPAGFIAVAGQWCAFL